MIKFQNFQGPTLFSRTFQVLEKLIIVFKDLQRLLRQCGHPDRRLLLPDAGVKVHMEPGINTSTWSTNSLGVFGWLTTKQE